MRKSLLILFAGFISFASQAQGLNRNSLKRTINYNKKDSNTVNVLYQYGETYRQDNPDSATFYYNKAKELSQNIGYKKGVATYASYQIVILNNKGLFKEALSLTLDALDIFKKYGNKKDLSVANLNVGSEWEYLSDFSTASEYYLIAKKYAEEIDDKKMLRIANNNLASVFINLQEYAKGLEYAEKAYKLAVELNNKTAQANTLCNIGTASNNLKNYDKAISVFREVGKIGKEEKDNINIVSGWLGIADALKGKQMYALAIKYYDTVLYFSRHEELPEYTLYANMGMGQTLIESRKYLKAVPYLNEGINLAHKFGSKNELSSLYEYQSNLYKGVGKLDSALAYRQKFELLRDTILGENTKNTVANLAAKYEFEKKEAQIKLQQAQLRQKSILNYILIGSALAILIISLLGYRNYIHRQKLQQLKIDELETEKQLTATEAVLKGEEQERTRLAKDLHDGLGGMLSGIKFSLNNMKENLIMTPDNALAFNRSIDMLDSSIQEMRRVAHNMMPEILVKYGLDVALKEFCMEMDRSAVLHVNYQSVGMQRTSIPQTTSVAIYRIIQELLNNAIKHAHAKNVLVQLHQADQEKLLAITVEDDGNGFDVNLLTQSGGMGWHNIKNRVEFLKGRIDLQSGPGKGTSVMIEINI